MPQMMGSFQAPPLWRVWGPANASYAYLVVPSPFQWQDSTQDTIPGHRAVYLLPENAPALDRTASEFIVLCYQRPGARPLYAVRDKDFATADSLISAVVGSVNWAPIRWILRTYATDYEMA